MEELRVDDLLRRPHRIRGTGPRAQVDGTEALLLCSNNYLGLADHPVIARGAAAAATKWGAGMAASRLISGDTDLHHALEQRLAQHVGLPSALVLPSGYHANMGVLPALAGPGDLIVSDERNHASIIDGCRLSRAEVVVTPHCDVGAVRAALLTARRGGRALVVTESLFSMDGDRAPLAELRAVCDSAGAGLIVDEAHALGVLGPAGAGGCAAAAVRPDVLVGTLGKAFGVAGAFVAGDDPLRDLLVSTCRTFVFTTAVPPAVLGAALAATPLVAEADDRRARLRDLAALARGILGPRVAAGAAGPILPIVIGDSAETMRISRSLLEQGYFVQGIRRPTVPAGTSRLRLTLMATHRPEDVEAAMHAICKVLP